MAVLATYKGLERLELIWVGIDLEVNKDKILDVMKIHCDTLTHVAFSNNKFTNTFITHICDGIRETNRLESIEMKDIKECRYIDWVALLKSVASLSVRPDHVIRLTLSSCQTQLRQQ